MHADFIVGLDHGVLCVRVMLFWVSPALQPAPLRLSLSLSLVQNLRILAAKTKLNGHGMWRVFP